MSSVASSSNSVSHIGCSSGVSGKSTFEQPIAKIVSIIGLQLVKPLLETSNDYSAKIMMCRLKSMCSTSETKTIDPSKLNAQAEVINQAIKHAFKQLFKVLNKDEEVTPVFVEDLNGLLLQSHCLREVRATVNAAGNANELEDLLNITYTEYQETHPKAKNLDENWYKGYKRRIYDRTHSSKTCSQLLWDYLVNSKTKDVENCLSTLFLSPKDLQESPNREDIKCFEEALNNNKGCNAAKKLVFFEECKKQYPFVSKLLTQLLMGQVPELSRNKNGYHEIFQKLKESVIGQDMAAQRLASSLDSHVENNHSKTEVFLFVGPSGVGKTELAKAVATYKTGEQKKERLIILPMNQYSDENRVVDFFGSPVGYLASDDKPSFAKQLDAFVINNDSLTQLIVKDVVLIFDEFEKAHKKIQQSFLTLFDEGYLEFTYTLSKKRTEAEKNVKMKYTFLNCIFICTSNLYQKEICKAFHEGANADEIGNVFKKKCLSPPTEYGESRFSPELLNRQTIIPFGPIPKGTHYFQKILEIKWAQFVSELIKDTGWGELAIANKQQTLSVLEEKLYGEGIDMRKIMRYFNDKVKTAINTQKIMWNKDPKFVKIILDVDENKKLFIRASVYINSLSSYLLIEDSSYFIDQ